VFVYVRARFMLLSSDIYARALVSRGELLYGLCSGIKLGGRMCLITKCSGHLRLYLCSGLVLFIVFPCFVALEMSEYSLGNQVHLQLMTDHISEVSVWMVGIKKLIQAGLDMN